MVNIHKAAIHVFATLSIVLALPASSVAVPKKILKAKPTKTAVIKDTGWKNLFDGKTLAGWKQTTFVGGGEVKVEPKFRDGEPAIVVKAGSMLSGFNWTRDAPKTNFEISLEVMKIEGKDFMCGLTFPVGDSHASLILGGWGGPIVGISSLDRLDASENETTKYMSFVNDHWYKVRMKVTPDKLESWLDDQKIVDVNIKGKVISLRVGEIIYSVPIGIATYQSSSAFRNIKIHKFQGK